MQKRGAHSPDTDLLIGPKLGFNFPTHFNLTKLSPLLNL